MENLAVTVEMPRDVLAAAGVREHELGPLIREALAVDLYRRGQISLGKAAEIAGMPTKWEMLSVLTRRDVWIDHTAEDALRDAEAVRIALAL